MINEISSLFGLNIYTDKGIYVGKVEDVVIDLGRRQIRGLALKEYNRSIIESDAPGIILPYRIVKSVGDIIIVKDVFTFKKDREDKKIEEVIEVD